MMIKPPIQAVVLVVAAIIVCTSMVLGAAVCVDPAGVWADGPVMALATSGNLALAGAGPVLMIIDVEDPAHPVVLSQITLPGTILDLAVDDDVVIAALGGHGAAVVDIANPWAPSQVAVLAVDGFAETVATAGSVLAVAVSAGPNQDYWRLDFFDLSDFDDPGALGSIEHPGGEDFYGSYDGVAMDDRFAYWVSGPMTSVIDFDDPNGPRLVNQHHHPGLSHCWVAGIGVSAGRLVIARNWLSGDLRTEEATLGVFEVDASGNVEEIGTWAARDDLWWDVAVTQGRAAAYRYNNENVVMLFSLASPSDPRPVAWIPMHSSDRVDVLAPGESWVIASDGDLRIAGFRGNTGLEWVSGIDTADRAVAVTADDRNAFVVTGSPGVYPASNLHVLDISRPAKPVEIALVSVELGRDLDLAVIGDRLVAVSAYDDIVTYDVSIPESPVLETRLAIPGEIYQHQDSLAVGPGVVYVLWNGYPIGLDHDVISVLDFSNPSDPVDVNEIAVDSTAQGLSIFGDLMMVPTSRGMWLFDVTAPAAPSLLSQVDDVGTWLRGGAIGDGAAYIGDDDGLHVLDLTNPEQPVVAGFQRIEGGAWRLLVTPGFLWVGTRYVSPRNSGDLLVYDIRDPLHPVLVKGPIGPRGMTEVFRRGSHVLVASPFEGFEVFSTRCRYSAETQHPRSEID